METRMRSLVKAFTWQLIGLLTMTMIAWLITGDLGASGGVAVAAAVSGFCCFIVHERIWAHIRWGRSELRPREHRAHSRS